MSWRTWTPDALSSEARPYRVAAAWRAVEAQHVAATMRLTDSLEEQRVLEELVEAHKPPVPPAVPRSLDYLLSTPFRYRPGHRGSRFRAPGERRGVFYAAELERAALAEKAFYKLLDLAESVGATSPTWSGQVTLFSVPLATARTLDLTAPPLAADRAAWVRLTDYGPCQALASASRKAAIDLIRYESVRDPERSAALALLDPAGFAAKKPKALRTWHLHADARGARVAEDFTRRAFAFPREQFDADPRMAPLASLT
jgi:hypothetical protein